MRLLIFLLLLGLSSFLSLINGLEIFARLTYLLVIILALSYIWAFLSVRGIRLESQLNSPTAQVGQTAEGNVTLFNNSAVPKLWLEVKQHAGLPGNDAARVISVDSKRSRWWRTGFECIKRGRYTIGPFTIAGGDPFGMFQRRRTLGDSHNLTVYPAVVEIPYFSVPPADLPGEGRHRRRTHFVTPNASTVREYVFGDSFNRIHWRSTARTGQLMVKEFELDPASEIWIMLDLHEGVQAGEGLESTEEYGVTIAASIAKSYLDSNRAIGFVSFGTDYALLKPDRGPNQTAHVMETLALAEAKGIIPLQDLIVSEGKRFGRYTTLVVITSSGDEAWVHSVQHLIRRGASVAAVLMDPSTFNGVESNLLALSTLLASGIQTHLIRKGDDLSRALSAAGEGAPTPQGPVT